jgi:broad specificity phosphatase PhoE
MTLSQDDSQWPIVVDAVIGEPTDDEIRGYNARRAERLARAERHAQVIDGRAGVRMSTRHRRMMAEFDEQNREAQRRYVAGVALVVSSGVLRVLLRAIYQATPSAFPRKACRSIEEATSWARSLLESSPP